MAAIVGASGMQIEQGRLGKGAGAAVRAYFAEAAGATAKFVTGDDGPRAGALTFDDWDTDADEGATNGRLAALLGALDGTRRDPERHGGCLARLRGE